jgi:hypothetical protein
MTKSVLFAIVLFLSLMPAACYQPVRYSAKNESFLQQHAGKEPWHTVAVLPFSGHPVLNRMSAEWFTHLIDKHHLFDIIGPSVSQIELGKQGVLLGDADIPIGTAQEAGRVLGAEGVIVGSIKKEPATGNRYIAAVSIVDVSTGRVVATIVRSDFQQGMMGGEIAAAATAQVANDLLPVLYALANRTWTPPPEKQGGEPWGER